MARSAVALFVMLAAAAFGATRPAAGQTYVITDLGELDPVVQWHPGTLGGHGSSAQDLNDQNVVVGHSDTEVASIRGFIWRQNLGMEPLGPPLDYELAIAEAVNEACEMVGTSSRDGFIDAYLWRCDGSTANLGSLNGARAHALDVNDAATVVGWGSVAGGSFDGIEHAFRWQGGMADLGTLPGGEASRAEAINSGGSIVGSSSASSGGTHAVLWNPQGIPQDLGTLGGLNSKAMDVDDEGRVVGAADTPLETMHAVLWDLAGTPHDLGTLAGGDFSQANAINACGMIVGFSNTDPVGPHDGMEHAVRWDSTGVLEDLNDLVSPGSGWTLHQALAINNRGRIAGFGTNPAGRKRAFLLTPTGAPAPCGPDTVVAVDVVGFIAMSDGREVKLTWQSAYEDDHLGFDVLRAEAGGGRFQRMNEELITADGGAGYYRFVDRQVIPGASYDYRLEGLDESGARTTIGTTRITVVPAPPARLALGPARPNPFRDATAFTFELPAESRVVVRIHDTCGRTVRTLADRVLEAGRHTIEWDGRDDRGRRAGSGAYWFRLDSDTGRLARELLMLK